MKKTTNVIVRVDPDLKAQAEEACSYLGMTLSSLLRHTMQSVVRQHHQTRANDTAYARAFVQGNSAQLAYDALKREIDANGGAKEYPIPVQPSSDRQHTSDMAKPSRPSIDASGAIDPATMSRKLRRQYARDKAKGKV
ncbi:MAG: type II toxin-antitoxin system RelB/DinJ family antitoxin [Methylophilaceae bacterium]